MSKSHVLFQADCQLKSIEERQKKSRDPTQEPELYWTVRDHDDVVYLAYRNQIRQVRILERLLPTNPEMMSPPVRLEGYVSRPNGQKFFCLLRVLIWNSDTKIYDVPELPAEGRETIDPETDELERLYLEKLENE